MSLGSFSIILRLPVKKKLGEMADHEGLYDEMRANTFQQ